jgi:hypothetical protein
MATHLDSGSCRPRDRFSPAFATTTVLAMLPLTVATLLLYADNARAELRAPRASEAPRVDGSPEDHAWTLAGWHSVEHRWLGPELAPGDFSGRFKVVWTERWSGQSSGSTCYSNLWTTS